MRAATVAVASQLAHSFEELGTMQFVAGVDEVAWASRDKSMLELKRQVKDIAHKHLQLAGHGKNVTANQTQYLEAINEYVDQFVGTLNSSHQENVEELEALHAAVVTSNSNVSAGVKGMHDLKTSHNACRGSEVKQKTKARHACDKYETDSNAALALKVDQGSCYAQLPVAFSQTFPAPTAGWFDKEGCNMAAFTDALATAKLSFQDCNTEFGLYVDQINTCKTEQEKFEQGACVQHGLQNGICQNIEQLYNTSVDIYEKACARVVAAANARKQTYADISTIKCIVKALQDGSTLDLDKCESSSPDDVWLSITCLPKPSMNPCSLAAPPGVTDFATEHYENHQWFGEATNSATDQKSIVDAGVDVPCTDLRDKVEPAQMTWGNADVVTCCSCNHQWHHVVPGSSFDAVGSQVRFAIESSSYDTVYRNFAVGELKPGTNYDMVDGTRVSLCFPDHGHRQDCSDSVTKNFVLPNRQVFWSEWANFSWSKDKTYVLALYHVCGPDGYVYWNNKPFAGAKSYWSGNDQGDRWYDIWGIDVK